MEEIKLAPTKFLRVNKWSYRVTEVKVGADGQLVE